jgi:predicted membrane protein
MDTQLMERPTPPFAPAVAGGKLVAGIFFAVLGLVMTLDNLDLFEGYRILRFWPLVLIVIGAMKLRDRRDQMMAIIAIGAGVLLLGSNLHWFRLSIFDLWPLALVVAGGVVVMHALGWRPELASGDPRRNVWAVLSGPNVRIDSRDYSGGRIVACMGGCVLDLTGADIESGTAVIEAVAIWGGIEIRIPEGWEVVGEVMPIMGGVEIKTKARRGGRQLVVRGLALMGGMEIKAMPARTA